MRRLPLVMRIGGPVLAIAMLPGAVSSLDGAAQEPGTVPPSWTGPVTRDAAPSVAGGLSAVVGPLSGLPACDVATASGLPLPTRAPRGPDPAGSWWRLDPILDESGWLAGQRLHVGRLTASGIPHAQHVFDLPAESFAAGPVAGRIVVGADDGSTSTLSIVDTGRSCRIEVATEPDIVRRAILAPDGQTVFEFRLARASRADLGIWRRDLTEPGAAAQVLGPLEDDERFGPTWTTELVLDGGGERLLVESCGERACRLRILDPATGAVTLHAEPGLGELVGVAAGRPFLRAACPGLPCPVLVLEAAGEPRIVVEAAGSAVLADGPDGTRLLVESPDGRHVLAIDPASGAVMRSAVLDPGMRLVPAPSRSLSGVEIPAASGHAARSGMAAPDGRIGDGTPLRVLDPALPALSDLEEVIR